MEQRQVRVQELWQVDVHDGTQHQHVFVFIRIFQLKTHLALHMTVLYTPYYYTRLTASFPGQPGQAGTRKVKPVWI